MASPAPTCLQGLQATCFTDTAEVPLQKSQLSRRWLMLFFLCTGLLGSYYSYDIPSATQNAMQEYFAGGGACNTTVVDDDAACASSASAASFSVYFNNLYSVYSFPNIILPFFGGYLSDRLGFRLMLLVFLALITAGQAIFALGASLPGMSAWWVMWAGRTVFGFGGESLSVAQSALIASWFSGKELAFALGLNLSLARMGSVINDKVSNFLATSYSLPLAFWVGFGVCLLSLVAGLFTYVVDQTAEDRLRSNAGKRPLKRTPLLHMMLCLPLCPCGRRGLAGDEDALTRLVDDSLEEEGGSGSGSGASKAGDYEPEEATEVIELSAAGQFPLSFWLLCVSCVCTYACVLCFNNVAEGFFAQKWLAQNAQGAWVPFHTLDAATKQSASDKATTLLLITYLVAAFLAPVFGGVIDLVGYRAVLAAFSSGLITVVHVLLAFFPRDAVRPEGPLVLLGLCYSIYASALWPSVALVTEKQHHGTAYGIVTAVQNLGLAVIPLGVGVLQPSNTCKTYDECVAGWTRVEMLLVGFGAVGFGASVCLNLVDCRQRIQVLNWSSARVEEARKAEQGGSSLNTVELSAQ